MSVPALRQYWRVAAISVVIAFVYATVLRKLGVDWWNDENYSHGLLIPFVIGYLLWSKRDRLASESLRPSTVWGAIAVVLALLGLWAGIAGAELYTQRLSLLLMLAGITLYFWGFAILRSILVPLALLFLALPIPSIVFNKIAFPLQLFASECAVSAMRLFGIPVLRQGNVIELLPRGAVVTKKLEVVEACSGIRSLMTLVTLAVVFAYVTYPRLDGDNRRSISEWLKSYGFWRSMILLISAIPIAIATNALRVSGTGVLAHYYGTGIADGFFHSFSGWVMYISAAFLMFAASWSLERFNRGGARNGTSQEQNSTATEKTTTVASIAAHTAQLRADEAD